MSTFSNDGEKGPKPFNPIGFGGDTEKRIAHSLEYIATAMERIDHNLELLTRTVREGEQKAGSSRKVRSQS